MQPWKLILAYDGSPFHGWQVQPGLPTVQGTLATAIRHISGETVLPQGSGRTDTGVHALGQVASFALVAPIPPSNFLRALNRILPSAIRILSAEHAPPDFHARHSALRKTYEYRIFPRVPNRPVEGEEIPDRICPPMLSPYAWDCPWHIDLALARQAAVQVIGEHDFTSFSAADPDLATRTDGEGEGKSPIRTIFASDWQEESGLMVYRVTGSGFLHHMVRNLVGTFVEVACGRTLPEDIPHILAVRKRCAAGQTAPPQGLFLVNVEYPEPGKGAGAPHLDSEMWDGAAPRSPMVEP
jgi:tRNA pseudouridine38-40 synthase